MILLVLVYIYIFRYIFMFPAVRYPDTTCLLLMGHLYATCHVCCQLYI
jgi:hypothetical protein